MVSAMRGRGASRCQMEMRRNRRASIVTILSRGGQLYAE